MAKIIGSVEKNDYGFYAVLTETKPSNFLSVNATTVNYSVYIQNGNKRTSSSNWTFNAKIDESDIYNKTKQSLVTNDTDYNTAKLLFSGSETITHDTDGSKTITFSASLTKSTSYSSYDPGKCELEGTFKLTTIERMATVLTATDFTDEESPTLTFNNPAEFTVYPYINFYDDSNNIVFSLYRDSESIKSPYTWEFTDEERNSLWKATNQQQTYKAEIGVKTYNDSTYLGSNSIDKTMSYVNAEPSQTTVFTELNPKVIDLLGSSTADIIIQNISQLKLVSTPIVKKDATITKIQFEHNNISVADSEEPYEHTITPGNSIFKVTINDSRKYSIQESYTKDIIEYLPINILSFSIKRVSSTSADISLNSEIRYKHANFGNTQNVPTIQWKCGTNGELNILTTSDYTIDETNNLIKISNLTLKDVKPYDEEDTIYLYVSDLLTEDTENTPLLRGIPTMDMGKDDVNINGDLTISDKDGNNPVNVLDEINLLNFDVEELRNKTNIVYEKNLTENTNTIEVTGLDMVRDGGEYEFEFIHAENNSEDVQITFNNITTGYYQQGIYTGGILSSNGELETKTFFRKGMDRIYYATGGTTTIQFPSIMKGRFLFSNLTRKAVYYELKNVIVLNEQQAITELYGVNDQPVDNLTSIKFSKLTGAYFLAGTRLIIRKK